MKKLLLAFCLIILLNGCSSYKALKHFEKNDAFTQASMYSKKADILVNNDVQTIFYASYMNKIDEGFNDKYHNFVIGIYSLKEDISDFSLSLNKNSYDKIKMLEQNSPEYQMVSLKNAWAKYYYISFKKTEHVSKLNLILRNVNYKEGVISFLN